MVASVFFWFQRKNTRMLNLIWKERFEHLLENSINYLLWMKNGCIHVQNECKKGLDKHSSMQELIEKLPTKSLGQLIDELKAANKRTLIKINQYIEKYPDFVTPQQEATLLNISEHNEKIGPDVEEYHKNIQELAEIIKQIDLLNEKYNVKRSGTSPEPAYATNIIEKIQSDKWASLVFFIPGIIILYFPIVDHGLFNTDILNNWVTYFGLYFIIFGVTFTTKLKYQAPGLWFILGSPIMLALGLLVGFNILQF